MGNQVGLQRMQSSVQKFYVRILCVTYKPVFHILFATSVPGMIAYCWLTMALMLVPALIIQFVGLKFLRCVLILHWISRSREPDEELRSVAHHLNLHRKAWG